MKVWKEENICRSASGPKFFNTEKINALEAEGWHLHSTFVDPRFPSFGQNISGLFWRDEAAPTVKAVELDEAKAARPSIDDDEPIFPKKRGRPPKVTVEA